MDQMNIILISLISLILFLISFPWYFKLFKLIFQKTKFHQLGQSSQIRLIKQLNDAVDKLSETRIGAIITILKKQNIDNLRTDGIKIDADISSQLIISIFQKTSPIHDGAIIIDNKKISYAGTYFRITSKSIDNKYGARHRAALGISEKSDSLTIVISEETGVISFVVDKLIFKIKKNDFQEKLSEYLK